MIDAQLDVCEGLAKLDQLIFTHTMGRIRALLVDELASHIFGLGKNQSAYVRTAMGEIRVACGPLVRVK